MKINPEPQLFPSFIEAITSIPFKIGEFSFCDKNASDDLNCQLTLQFIENHFESNEILQFSYLHYLSYEGLSLLEASKYSIFNMINELQSNWLMEHYIGPGLLDGFAKECIYHLALSLNPSSSIAAKNYGFQLESLGFYNAASSLLRQSVELTNDRGTAIQLTFLAPSIPRSLCDIFQIFSNIKERVGHGFNRMDTTGTVDAAFLEVRALQTNIQYLGISPAVLLHWHYLMVDRVYGFYIENDRIIRDSNLKLDRAKRNGLIRFGIVSEQSMNSSPSLCLLNVVSPLVEVLQAHSYQIVYFSRMRNSYELYFNKLLGDIADEVIALDDTNFEESRERVLAAGIDMLLYLALPTEKFTLFLSYLRLAPIQIQYGIGHPITSGSSVIDYSVISEAMYPRVWFNAAVCGNEYAIGVDVRLPDVECAGSNIKREHVGSIGMCDQSYVEQEVLFSSLGYYLDDPLSLYEDSFDPVQFVRNSTCAEINDELSMWGLLGQLRAEQLGCEGLDRTVHLYACLQIPRKLHPLFDRAIAGILFADSTSKILLYENSKVLLPRWGRLMNATNLLERLIFVPRLSHRKYLRLLSLSSAFLNTFPFGAGITSSEALAVGVPVVVFPNATSVLQLALAQVSKLGPEIGKQLIAWTGVTEYVVKAVSAAWSADYHSNSTAPNLRQHILDRKHLLFGNNVHNESVQEWFHFIRRLARASSK